MIGEYQRHGRLHDGTPDDMEAAIIDAWSLARQRGESVALMANTNHTVDRLNQLAQQRRITTGELDPDGPGLDVGDQRLLIGDDVVTRRNQRTLRTNQGAMVKNRDHWSVEEIHGDGAVTVGGRTGRVRLPADYSHQYLELGYAQTSHATQGRTVDTGLLLIDGPTDHRGLYTPLTRGRDANHAYVVTREGETATDVLTTAISRDWIDQPTISRRTRPEIAVAANLSEQRSEPDCHRQPAAHPPGHEIAIDDHRSEDEQAWQAVSRSIEAARQRRTAERSPNRHHRGIGR